MDMTQIAAQMWPCWLLGFLMVFLTMTSGNKDLLRVEKVPLAKWCLLMVFVTIIRLFSFKYYMKLDFMRQGVINASVIPWQASLTVFWEDMVHVVPLALLARMLGTRRFAVPIRYLATAIAMIAFGSAHLYQGVFAALLISLYVPMSYDIAMRRGFGTVILGHMVYDFSTMLLIKHMLGGF